MSSALRSLLVGLALLALAALFDLRLARYDLSRPYDVAHVPSGKVARVAALGHRTFLSDLYWLDAVQYIGEPRADQRGWDKLFPLIDLVTDLDPRHGYAYQTAGIVLSAQGRLEESDRILKKGLEQGPKWWTFPYYLAFNAWFYRGDYQQGARYAEMAALMPGASTNVAHLAVSLKSKTGRPEDAIEMIEELKKTVKDEKSAGALDDQLKLAVLERDAQALERAAAEFEERFHRPIASLDELLASHLVERLPDDPFGGHYYWDAGEGRVHSSANSFRFRRPDGAHRPSGFQYQTKSGVRP